MLPTLFYYYFYIVMMVVFVVTAHFRSVPTPEYRILLCILRVGIILYNVRV